MNDLPGYQVDQVLRDVTGLTVRSRNIGAQLGAGFKAIVGGELEGLTKQLVQPREEALQRMVDAATERRGNTILAMRFDANEVSQGDQEVVAYGTAVKVSQRTGHALPPTARQQQTHVAVVTAQRPICRLRLTHVTYAGGRARTMIQGNDPGLEDLS